MAKVVAQLNHNKCFTKTSTPAKRSKGHGFTRKCATLVREQRAGICVLRCCATMLLCWYIEGDDQIQHAYINILINFFPYFFSISYKKKKKKPKGYVKYSISRCGLSHRLFYALTLHQVWFWFMGSSYVANTIYSPCSSSVCSSNFWPYWLLQ